MNATTGLRASDGRGIRWLHLSDLHIGNQNESQATAMGLLVNAIERFAEGIPFDLVLITGDLAFSGRKDEYDQLEAILIGPLRKSAICSSAKVIATPGNHDLNCDIGIPPIWQQIGPKRQEAFFHFGDNGRQIRSQRALAFADYQRFVSKSGIASVDPTRDPACSLLEEIRGQKIALMPVVTAFFSDREVPDKQRAPAPIHPLRTLLLRLPEGTQPVILGHHPPEWFTPESELQFHSLLVEKNALYLHGHEHRIRSRFGIKGLTSLGFGAAYQAPSDSAPKAVYRNSFAICQLDESLHVHIVSWDSEYGQWRSDQNLPGDFIRRSSQLTDGYQLVLPTTKLIDQSTLNLGSLAAAIRHDISVDRCMWLATDAAESWTKILVTLGRLRGVSGHFSLPSQALPPGHSQFRANDQDGPHLIRAISAHGDILSYEQLQSINTDFDTQDYTGGVVATLGDVADDARTLAAQLGTRKALSVLDSKEIAKGLVHSLPQALEEALLQNDPAVAAASLLVTDAGIAVLLRERTNNSWFFVLAEDGRPLSEADPLIQRVRTELPVLKSVRYGKVDDVGIGAPGPVEADLFDRAKYLHLCHELFNEVKYAPLAALGLRFRKASLSEIYVEANADVGGNTKTSHHVTRALNEFVDSLNLPPQQRDQLESQLRSKYGLGRSAEVGAARLLYQRHNNVLVLGDPGSGKTCFLKHEILAYCEPRTEQATWYSQHLPIYVALAEAARLLDGKTDIISLCEILSSRRGVPLPRATIESHLFEGRCAFFFDGLDEVGLLEKRIELLAGIEELVETYSPRGNRFVVASRPAAVEPVDIPEALTYLELKGLTEEEIRILAGRVLRVRVSEQEKGELSFDERELVDKLIEDTETSTGIARLARNPLLLTLLVLIYANTGALSAKRHLVYTQAIKTLVSVRGRQTRAQQISEADLRTRLGALALAIFQREVAEIPRRQEVLNVLAPLMTSGQEKPRQAAEAFVQEVAEATGLLAIHSQSEKPVDDLISFMHYSFLEYYAATGVLSKSPSTILARHASNPRWRDVITLLFGVLSEQADITPLLQTVLQRGTDKADEITKYRLLLGLDCAAECDVPPESAQDLLAAELFRTLSDGPAKYSAELRSEIAKKLESLVVSCGSRFAATFAEGLRSADASTVAAFADLIARFAEGIEVLPIVQEAFQLALKIEASATRAAVMFAIERRPELRTAETIPFIADSLEGTIVEKHAALKAVAAVPIFYDYVSSQVRDLLDDSNSWIAKAAAQCVLGNALDKATWSNSGALVDKALNRVSRVDHETGLSVRMLNLDAAVLGPMMFSADPNLSELAIRHAAFVEGEARLIYGSLIRRFREGGSPRIIAACLDALRGAPSAMDLINLADTNEICKAVSADHKNVRLAAIKLLGELPDDEQVVRTLQSALKAYAQNTAVAWEEVAACASALAHHVRKNLKLRSSVLNDIANLLPKSADAGFGKPERQRHIVALLTICEAIGGVGHQGTSRRLRGLVDDYKTPIDIRRQALQVIGRIIEPSEESARYVISFLDRDDLRLNDAAYGAAASFTLQCQRKVEYARRVHGLLPEFGEAVISAWRREVPRVSESTDPPTLQNLRIAMVACSNLAMSYEEFAQRASAAQSGRNTVTP